MCGITMLLNNKDVADPEDVIYESLKRIRHRGPDFTGFLMKIMRNAYFGHERLAIVSPETGEQPLCNKDETLVLIINGEIYHYLELAERYQIDAKTLRTDCDIIVKLWPLLKEKHTGDVDLAMKELCAVLRPGVFAFCLADFEEGVVFVARDGVGVCPLYVGVSDRARTIMFSSELKGLCHPRLTQTFQFPPGHWLKLNASEDEDDNSVGPQWQMAKRYPPQIALSCILREQCQQHWSVRHANASVELPDVVAHDSPYIDQFKAYASVVSEELRRAVRQRIDACDVPFGVLLSGGLDSSVVAALAAEYVRERSPGSVLHSFSVGMHDSPDLAAARQVAAHIGTKHHEIVFTAQQARFAVRDVIIHTETYDVTTIRSSVPMSLLLRYVKAFGIKMVLSGEGADEVFGGYLYFHYAPSDEAFREETFTKVEQLFHYDVLRANKVCAMWGVEVRVPFLDTRLLEVAMHTVPTRFKRPQPLPGAGESAPRIEKALLRYAFRSLLPAEIVERQKEQFSDGVGHGWIDSIQEYADDVVGDKTFSERTQNYAFQTPATKEGYYYRTEFNSEFTCRQKSACVGGRSEACVFTQASAACSTKTALEWLGNTDHTADPSGRSIRKVYAEKHQE